MFVPSIYGDIIVNRTGKCYSISSSEYELIYPDGYRNTIWSPPWHAMSKEEEDKEACRQVAIHAEEWKQDKGEVK